MARVTGPFTASAEMPVSGMDIAVPSGADENSGANTTGNNEAASGRIAANELYDRVLKAGNYGTADLLNERDTRLAREEGRLPEQPAQEDLTPQQLSAQAASPAAEQAPAQLAATQQALVEMDRGGPAAAEERTAPQASFDFSSLLASAGVSLAACGVSREWQNVPESEAMNFNAQQFAGQTLPSHEAVRGA